MILTWADAFVGAKIFLNMIIWHEIGNFKKIFLILLPFSFTLTIANTP